MKSGRVFPDRITSLLELFYAQGLTGWGAKHTATFEEALKSTSLSPAQLQVYIYIGTRI